MRGTFSDRLTARHGSRSDLVGDGLLAAVMAVALLPITVAAVWGGSWPRTLEVVVICLVVIGHAAVATRRLAPRVSLAVGGAMMLVLVLTPLLDPGQEAGAFSAVLTPSVLVFPVLLYSVAAWSSPVFSFLALGASGAGALLVVARLWGASYLTVAQPGLAPTTQPVRSWALFLLLAVIATVIAPWLLGRYRRLRLLYVAELEDRARREEADRATSSRRAVEHERQRIAREMHDVVAHSLAVIVNQAEGGRLVSSRDPERAASALGNIAGVGRDAMSDMRGILAVLHQDDDAPSLPQPTLAALPDLIASVRRTGLPIRTTESGTRHPMCPTADLAGYRFVQEALTNVLKHAGTSAPVEVTLTWHPDTLEATVCNQVEGEAPASAGAGRGLSGMATRMSALGGSLSVSSAEREFRVTATIPLEAAEPAEQPEQPEQPEEATR